MSAHDQAAQWYAKAYDVVNKGKEDLANGKDKNAKKKFKDGYSRGEQIVEADSTYHEAWNLMGYTARQLGWLDKSLDAYQHCLRIKPDYAPAHEYLGETYIEMKQLDKAKDELAKLESLGATDDANTLRTAIAAYEKQNPASASASGSN
jgi:tetratricopeptide (TPR) repeat protein